MNLYFQLGQRMPKRGPSTVLQEPLGKYLYEALTHRNTGRTRRLGCDKDSEAECAMQKLRMAGQVLRRGHPHRHCEVFFLLAYR
jgi:hypothetical protein